MIGICFRKVGQASLGSRRPTIAVDGGPALAKASRSHPGLRKRCMFGSKSGWEFMSAPVGRMVALEPALAGLLDGGFSRWPRGLFPLRRRRIQEARLKSGSKGIDGGSVDHQLKLVANTDLMAEQKEHQRLQVWYVYFARASPTLRIMGDVIIDHDFKPRLPVRRRPARGIGGARRRCVAQ